MFDELKAVSKYEPKLYKAVINTFGKSFEYTARYYEYRNIKEKEILLKEMKTKPLEYYTFLDGEEMDGGVDA